MEFENLLKLVECVSRSGLDAFSYEQNGTKIKMKKGSGVVRTELPVSVQAYVQGERQAEKQEQAPLPETPVKEALPDHVTLVKSPLVGVFYEAPGEDADPFVSVGDRVKKGQTLGIVEAMKLMNEIECECDGVIKEISVKNEEAVEYGQTLFVIVPAE